MEVLLVSRRQELANLLQYHLKPMGFEVRLHSDPAALALELDSLDPPITLFQVDDFPRHWKPLLAHLRSFRSRTEALFLLLASSGLEPEEAAKATHLGVNGIVTEDVSAKRGASHLLDLLRHYRLLQDKRSFTRYLVSDTDRVGLAFIHPLATVLVTGEVTEISVKGLSFAADRPDRCADLKTGTEIPACSLRIGGRIIGVDCRVMRSGKDLGLQFVSFEEGAHDALRSYIQERPDRALRAALQAGRQTPQAGDPGRPKGA